MSHAPGTYLGGIRTLADLRARCKVDECTGCWHLRTALGKPYPTGKRQAVHVYGKGSMPVLRVAYELSRGEPIPADRVVFRKCTSYDCIAPLHILRGTRQMMLQYQAKRGSHCTEAKIEANRRAGLARSRLSLELRQWIAESPQSSKELGDLLEIANTHISKLRQNMRAGQGVAA